MLGTPYIASALPLFLGFIWVGIDKRKQGWHDKLAGTVVIRNTSKEPVQFDSRV
ncbi:MAG: RDD family protein [Burkholderiales bacterium]|nr:RDD family protein [Burkholderiales bacterium]